MLFHEMRVHCTPTPTFDPHHVCIMQGHRSTLGEPLPLKRGMLHYAYSRKLPVQVRCCGWLGRADTCAHAVRATAQPGLQGLSQPAWPLLLSFLPDCDWRQQGGHHC